MNQQESAQLAAVLEAHWPHPAIDEFAEEAMRRALDGISMDRIERAVMRLVTTGERWQPRAPGIMAALAAIDEEDRRVAREMEWAEHDRTRHLEAEGVGAPMPAEVREQLARLRRGSRV